MLAIFYNVLLAIEKYKPIVIFLAKLFYLFVRTNHTKIISNLLIIFIK